MSRRPPAPGKIGVIVAVTFAAVLLAGYLTMKSMPFTIQLGPVKVHVADTPAEKHA